MFWEAQNAGFLHSAGGGIQEGLIRLTADLAKTKRRKKGWNWKRDKNKAKAAGPKSR